MPVPAKKIHIKGRLALVWGIIVLLGVTGFGLMFAALIMALSAVLGPILACVALGSGLLCVALLLMVLRPKTPPAPQTAVPTLAEAGFLFGFVAIRALLRKLETYNP